MTLSVNLAAYYRLDEASGNAIDSVATNTLTANNSPGSGTGKIGTARTFNGSNQSFTASSSSVFNYGDSDFTIACWVNLNSIATQSMLVTKFSTVGNNRQYALYYNVVTGRMSFLVNSSGISAQNVTINADTFGAIATSTWYYVVAWHDSVNNQIGISVNGVENTQSYSSGLFQSTASFRIGGRADSVEFTNGSIDGVGLWTKVLSSDERSRLYNDGNGLSYSQIIGATGIGGEVGWWCPSLDTIGNGTTLLNDLTGNGNNGTLTNMDAASDWLLSEDRYALDYDGTNDYVSCGIGLNSLFVHSKAFSISAWIYLTNVTGDRSILNNARITANFDGMNFLVAGGKLRFDLSGNTASFPLKRKESSSAAITANTWHHICVTKPANAATSAILLYINGSETASVNAFDDAITDVINTIPLQIGARHGTSSALAGLVDDVRVFDSVLSTANIAKLASQRGYQLTTGSRRRRYAGAYGL